MSIHINRWRLGWLGAATVAAVGVALLSIALVESAKGADRPVFASAGRRAYRTIWSARLAAPRQSKEREEEVIATEPLSSFARGYGGRFCIGRYLAYGVGGHVVVGSGRRRFAHG